MEWLNDYNKKFFNLEERKEWTLDEIYNDFIGYFEERESNEQKLEHFLKFLDTYIARITNIEEKNLLIEFYKQYDLSMNISTEFPKYVNNRIKQEMSILSPQFEEQVPINFFNLNGDDHFYDYIKELELKYFSKLIPRPLTLILKHNLTSKEKELFGGDLFHVLSFKFWHTNSRFELADNFKEVYREWLKEL